MPDASAHCKRLAIKLRGDVAHPDNRSIVKRFTEKPAAPRLARQCRRHKASWAMVIDAVSRRTPSRFADRNVRRLAA
jgi:hypothetical protein